MKTYHPSYYEKFRCAASQCTDTCCAAWEIVVEDDLIRRLERSDDPYAAFVLSHTAQDAEGDRYFVLENGKCPFLNSDNLCEIHIKLGQDYTCSVCKQHPRFIEEYDFFSEITPALSCPEANRLIFDEVLSDSVYPSPKGISEDALLNGLVECREKLLRYIVAAGDFRDKTAAVLYAGEILENAFTESGFGGGTPDLNFDKGLFPEIDSVFDIVNGMIPILLKSDEILTENWKTLLEKSYAVGFSEKKTAAFYKENGDDLAKALAYFVYRYFLKSVNDEDICLHALFCAVSVLTAAEISIRTDLQFRESVRLYSKEVEFDPDNIEMILNHLSLFAAEK